MINSSIDWSDEKTSLLSSISSDEYRRDLLKMIANIQKDVTKLSNIEVDFRRRGKPIHDHPLLKQINSQIEEVEAFIVVANLVG